MYEKKRILALIPARGGSKGIINKNIIDLSGKPLIAYTIEAANESEFIDEVIVSTDSVEIADIAKSYGASVPFMRPNELAGDLSKTIDVVIHAIRFDDYKDKFDSLILLQPTAPLRNGEDIDQAIKKYYSFGEKSLVSVSEVDDNPILIRTIEDDKCYPLFNLNSTCRRQDMQRYYRVNGAIYINSMKEIYPNTSFNDNRIAFVMEKSHSVDIDEMKDLYIAKYYIEKESLGEKQ